MAKTMTSAEETIMNTYAVKAGRMLARKVFEQRGSHSEAHLSEGELAEIIKVAFELGFNAGRETA